MAAQRQPRQENNKCNNKNMEDKVGSQQPQWLMSLLHNVIIVRSGYVCLLGSLYGVIRRCRLICPSTFFEELVL